jgi:hypothetical protein
VLDAPAVPEITFPTEVLGGESFTLTSSSETTHWYDAETATEALHVGGSYETSITESTTLWVEDVNIAGLVEAVGGRSEIGDGQFHDNSVRWLLFDAYEDMVIHTVDVYANGAGSREIGVIDASGNVLASAAYDLVDGMNTITLDFEVPAGTGYGLRSFSDDPQLWRDGQGTEMAYPYALGDLGSITQSTAGGSNATSYYYFFYNWVVQTPSVACVSERIPVTITVVGMEEWEQSNFEVFPNPSTGMFQIVSKNWTPGSTWQLVNTIGQVVLSGQLNGVSAMVDASVLPKGQYLLQVQQVEALSSVQIMLH